MRSIVAVVMALSCMLAVAAGGCIGPYQPLSELHFSFYLMYTSAYFKFTLTASQSTTVTVKRPIP